MAFLHCHTKNCGWSQDDFWEEGSYNPIRFIQKQSDLESYLFRDKMYFDKWMFDENPSLECHKDEKGWYCSGRDYLAWELRRKANNIEKMFIPTYEEWQKVKDTVKCPRCGERNWDID